MSQDIAVWIDDSYETADCHRAVWSSWRAQSKLKPGDFCFTSSKRLRKPGKWKGIASPAVRSFLARLAAFEEALQKKQPVLFVSAHSFFNLPLPDLSGFFSAISLGSASQDLYTSPLIFIRPEIDRPEFAEMLRRVRRSSSLTQAQIFTDTLFEKMGMQAFPQMESFFFDLSRLNHRPWYSNQTPAGVRWMELMKQAIQDGHYSEVRLRQEMLKGKVRPSLPAEYESLPAYNPVWYLQADQLDQVFVPPELRPSVQEIRRLYSWRVGLRGYWLRFENSVRIKGFFRTIASLGFKALRSLGKRVKAFFVRLFR